MKSKPHSASTPAELRRRAEARLRQRRFEAGDPKSAVDSRRLVHELQVHQVELEMQNAELQKARDALEVALEKYTDLYDFAPMGYCSIEESGVILEANLASAALLGVERSRLINRRLILFASPADRPLLQAFLEHVFTAPGDQACEVRLLKEGVGTFWAGVQATPAVALQGTRKWCRVAFADVTARKQAEEAQRRVEAMEAANLELTQEIVRRQAVEEAFRKSEQHAVQLLAQSRRSHEQLRLLSRRILSVQEEERKRISRELHDVIAQILTGINVRLATLKMDAAVNTKGLTKSISRTQRLVEQSVEVVHRFARELRPAVLDDLGLIPALHSFMKTFSKETGIRVSLTAFAGVEKFSSAKRTAFYRVAQEALTNVKRHAHASRVDVSIQRLANAVRMQIKDNGQSFDLQRVLHAGKSKRLGLIGMRERVEMVGGAFTVASAPGSGTTIQAQFPFTNGKKGRLNEKQTLAGR